MTLSENPFYMDGTDRTGEYRVLAASSMGRIGYRLLWDGRVRVRLEPSDEAHAAKLAEVLTVEAGWKQPGDYHQDRFSTVTPRGDEALAAVKLAFGVVKRGRPLVYNPDMPDYKADLAA